MNRRRVALALIMLLLAGCGSAVPRGTQLQVAPAAPPVVPDLPDTAPTAPAAAPADQPVPAPAMPAWVQSHPLGPAVTGNDTDTLLAAKNGVFWAKGWATERRFVAGYTSPASDDEVLLLVDTERQQLVQITVGRHGHLGPSPDQRHTLIRGGRLGGHPAVKVVEIATGQIVRTFPVESAQGSAEWLGPEQFVITDTPVSAMPGDGGRVMVASLQVNEPVTLSTEGRLEAVMPDGHLLIRQGPRDGPLFLFAPPYTKLPIQIAPGGVVRRDFKVNHAGRYVAWQEAAAVLIWDLQTGQTTLINLPGASWDSLRWSLDGTHLLAGHPDPANPGKTQLSRLYLRGHQTVIAEVGWPGRVHAVAETPEGDILFSAPGKKNDLWVTLLRRTPNGDLETLSDGEGPADWLIDRWGRWITWRQGMTQVRDLSTGAVTLHTRGSGQMIAPDGRRVLIADARRTPTSVEARFLTSP